MKRILHIGIHLLLFLLPFQGATQDLKIFGKVTVGGKKPLKNAEVGIFGTPHSDKTGKKGKYLIEGLKPGEYEIWVFALGFKTSKRAIELDSTDLRVDFVLDTLRQELEGVEIKSEKHSQELGLAKLRSIEGTSIYAGKKTEVVDIQNTQGDVATNQARELFGKVAGIISYEDGDAGIQMDVGSRGLDPSRSANFNVRQNGYDISADALGYPEAYYTPPAQALERIEVVRGAASLQYGPQFGGLLNFVFEKPPEDDGVEASSQHTLGSFGLLNSFTGVGVRKKKVGVYGFYHRRRGDGWRPNSEYDQETAYGSVVYNPTENTRIDLQFTHMNSLLHKPGGLTDDMFLEDPDRSLRERNWFSVNWNLGALKVTHDISKKMRVSTRFFGLMGSRNAVGFLEAINRADHGGERTLLQDEYRNFGNETRFLTDLELGGIRSTFLIGGRYYQGRTHRMQGEGSEGSGPDFSFEDPGQPDHSDHTFPSRNIAFFAENIFQLTEKWSFTPGVRYERIKTGFSGYYHLENTDLAGNIIYEDNIWEKSTRQRQFFLYGAGLSFKPSDHHELFGNFSTNYRGIGFNDLRLANPNFKVDPEIEDESGYTADIGYRGGKPGSYNVNISGFLLYYSDRIGAVLKRDEETYRTYRLRTNISDSRTTGIESFMELDLVDLFSDDPAFTLSIFSNITWQRAFYVNSEESAFEGNRVEMAPQWITRGGISFQKERFKAKIQQQYVSEQFSEATNAESVPSSMDGLIPSYTVMDLSLSYGYGPVELSGGVHNLMDNDYFTRRTRGYSGPGIVPAPPRNFYLTLKIEV